jgi:hypothetical protein
VTFVAQQPSNHEKIENGLRIRDQMETHVAMAAHPFVL